MILKTFTNVKSKIRTKMAAEVREKYNMNDIGVDGIISALNDFRDYVIVLFNDYMEILGAASYYLSKKSYIEVDHIGVIDRHKGYGTILMKAIFKLAKEQNRYPVSLVSNGFSNDFYEKLGMIRINKGSPVIYEMQKEQLDMV
jgi:N-acetylglutamate synthase-like GNAT family acetyltransferase